jgi:flavin-binding protein dodecin
MGDDVPGAVVKVIEVVGSSPTSFSDAVRNAVRTASQSIRHITGVEALHSTAEVGENGELSVYKVQCKIAFVVESSLEHEDANASPAVAASSTGAASSRGTG